MRRQISSLNIFLCKSIIYSSFRVFRCSKDGVFYVGYTGAEPGPEQIFYFLDWKPQWLT
jgi:hypothetical protein